MNTRQPTKEAARGKWDGILHALLGPDVIRKKHGPCPICGGKDRYRYDNKHDNGDYFCSVCGAGDGFDLICKVRKLEFKDAALLVDSVMGSVEKEPFRPRVDVEARRRHLNEVWLGSKHQHVRDEYLANRGLDIEKLKARNLLGDVRGTISLFNSDDKLHWSGVVSMVRNKKGSPVSLHRTYLKDDGTGILMNSDKKLMPPLELLKGCAIRLGDVMKATEIVIGEGLETTLAGCQILDMPGMATISANGLEEFEVPSHVVGVTICADNDASFTGQAAAFKCAFRLRNIDHRNVRVFMPANLGDDMLDFLLRGGELLQWYGGEK